MIKFFKSAKMWITVSFILIAASFYVALSRLFGRNIELNLNKEDMKKILETEREKNHVEINEIIISADNASDADDKLLNYLSDGIKKD